MQITRKSPKRRSWVRLLSAAAVALLAAIGPGVQADVYRWVGNPDSGPSDLFHAWRYQRTVGGTSLFFNWRQGADVATSTPGGNDTAVFDGFEGFPAYLNGPRTVKDIVINASGIIDASRINIVEGNLQLTSGNLTVNTSAGLARFTGGPLENQQSGTWFVDTNATFSITAGLLVNHGFTKTGAGTVNLGGPQLITSPIFIDQGAVNIDASNTSPLSGGHYITNDVFVGDSVGAAAEAILGVGFVNTSTARANPGDRIIAPSANVLVRADGFLQLGQVTDMNFPMQFNQLTLEGGQVEFFSGAPNFAPQQIVVRPGSRNGLTQPASINASANSTWDLGASGRTVSVLASTPEGIVTTDSLRIEASMSGGPLVLTGDGNTTIQGAVVNAHAGTSIRSGTLTVNKTPGVNAIGNYLDVGLGDTGSLGLSATVHLLASNQIPDTATMKVWSGGTFVLENGVSERIGELTFAGGNMNMGSNSTLTLGNSLTKVASGNSVATVGLLDLNSQTNTIDFAAGTSLTINGKIQNGSIVMNTPGTLTLGGGSGNTTSGFTITQGTLQLNKLGGASAIAGALTLGTLDQTTNLPTVRFLADHQVAINTAVVLRGGTLDLDGHVWLIENITAEGAGEIGINSGGPGGVLRVDDNFIAKPGASVTLSGDVSVSSFGTVYDARGDSLSQPGFTNFQLNDCDIFDGTFIKTGVGRVEFNNINVGSAIPPAVLNMTGGNALTSGSIRFGGLEGVAAVDVSGALELDVADGQTHVYSGALSGAGNLGKTGLGVQQFAGSASNTLSGPTIVSAGTLQLNKSSAKVAVAGNLTVNAGGRVETLQSTQISASSAVTVKGTLDTTAGDESMASLTIDGGQATANNLIVFGPVSTKNGSLSASSLFGFGDLDMDEGSTLTAVGAIDGHARLDSLATLTVPHSGPVGGFTSGLGVGGGFAAEHGSQISLIPGLPSDNALLTVEGGFKIGTTLPGPFGSTFMNGQTTIDLSLAGPLAPGVYNLIDFSDAPYFHPGAIFGAWATIGHFNFVPPSTPGAFGISNHVLQFTATHLPGDFNQDGSVGAADYAVWRDGNGAAYTQSDFDTWRANFGRVALGTGADHAAEVPEPASAMLILCIAGLLARRSVTGVDRANFITRFARPRHYRTV